MGNRNGKGFVVAAALAGLVGLMVVGCDSVGSSRAVPTFIPPTVAIPVLSPSNGAASQTPGVARGPSLVRVTRGSLAQTVNGRGRVGSVREATLYFPLKGVVNKIVAATGDQVSQGTPIAQLDTFQLEQDVTAGQFALDKARLDLKQAQARSSAADFKIDVAANVYTRTLQIRNQAYAEYQAIAGQGLPTRRSRHALTAFSRRTRISCKPQLISTTPRSRNSPPRSRSMPPTWRSCKTRRSWR